MNCKWCGTEIGEFPDDVMLHTRECPSAPEGVKAYAHNIIERAELPQVSGSEALVGAVENYKEKNGLARRKD